MALAIADRVKETSTTTGTGTYSLAGAVTGFRTFVAGIATGNTCYYVATDGTDWEVGLGTVTDATPDTLARTTILASSNAGAAVNWGAGTRTLFCDLPASVAVATAINQTFTKAQRGSITALTDGAHIATDLALNNFFSVTLAGNRTLDNPTNIVAGQSGSIFITQDATGSRTLAYGSYWDFAGGTAPTVSTAANSVDRLDYVVRTTTSIHAALTKAWA